jgi:hypothetical protein
MNLNFLKIVRFPGPAKEGLQQPVKAKMYQPDFSRQGLQPAGAAALEDRKMIHDHLLFLVP